MAHAATGHAGLVCCYGIAAALPVSAGACAHAQTSERSCVRAYNVDVLGVLLPRSEYTTGCRRPMLCGRVHAFMLCFGHAMCQVTLTLHPHVMFKFVGVQTQAASTHTRTHARKCACTRCVRMHIHVHAYGHPTHEHAQTWS